MWPKNYKDYPVDEPLIKEKVETGKGIVGCEMHERNGWGDEIHQQPRKKRKGFLSTILAQIFSKNSNSEDL